MNSMTNEQVRDLGKKIRIHILSLLKTFEMTSSPFKRPRKSQPISSVACFKNTTTTMTQSLLEQPKTVQKCFVFAEGSNLFAHVSLVK